MAMAIDCRFVDSVDEVNTPRTNGALVHELHVDGTREAVGRIMAVFFLNRSVGRIIYADVEQEIRRRSGNDRFALTDPTPDAVEQWVRDDARRTDPRALRGGKRALRRHAVKMTKRSPKVLAGMVCDGVRLPAEVLDTIDRVGLGDLDTLFAALDTARVTLKGFANRFPDLDGIMQRREYRLEDQEEQAARARAGKADADAIRERWIVREYGIVRPHHAPGRFGNVPAMEEVAERWTRSAPGRRCARETVRNILKRRGIDPASPATGVAVARPADFE